MTAESYTRFLNTMIWIQVIAMVIVLAASGVYWWIILLLGLFLLGSDLLIGGSAYGVGVAEGKKKTKPTRLR